MSELIRRLLFGIPAALFFIWLVWRGGVYFGALAGLLAFFTMLEMVRMFRRYKYPAYPVISVILATFVWVAASLPELWVTVTGVLIITLTLAALFLRSLEFGNRWVATLFCGTYAPLGFYLFYRIRELDPDTAGLWLALAVVAMIWSNDVFAYFGGRTFGKRPLAPSISPNKTWEGFWSGFAGSLVALILFWGLVDAFPLTLTAALPLAVITGLFGPLGDLLESRLKRIAGLKDSSNLLPGHGGFFDRFDALILVVPVLYLYLVWYL